jgi:hypothetical protein
MIQKRYVASTKYITNIPKTPLPQALLSRHKSGEENETGNIIEWGAS